MRIKFLDRGYCSFVLLLVATSFLLQAVECAATVLQECSISDKTLTTNDVIVNVSCSYTAFSNILMDGNMKLNISIAEIAAANPDAKIAVNISSMTLQNGATLVIDSTGYVSAKGPSVSIVIMSLIGSHGCLVFVGSFPPTTTIMVSGAQMTSSSKTPSTLSSLDPDSPTSFKIVMLVNVSLTKSLLTFINSSFKGVDSPIQILPVRITGASPMTISSGSSLVYMNCTISTASGDAFTAYSAIITSNFSALILSACTMSTAAPNRYAFRANAVTFSNHSVMAVTSCTMSSTALGEAAMIISAAVTFTSNSSMGLASSTVTSSGGMGIVFKSVVSFSSYSAIGFSACKVSISSGDYAFYMGSAASFSDHSTMGFTSCVIQSGKFAFFIVSSSFTTYSSIGLIACSAKSESDAVVMQSADFSGHSSMTLTESNLTSGSGNSFTMKSASFSDCSSISFRLCIISTAAGGGGYSFIMSVVSFSRQSSMRVTLCTMTLSSSGGNNVVSMSSMSLDQGSYWIMTNNTCTSSASSFPPVQLDGTQPLFIGTRSWVLWKGNSIQSLTAYGTCIQACLNFSTVLAAGTLSIIENNCSGRTLWNAPTITGDSGKVYQRCNTADGTLVLSGSAAVPRNTIAAGSCGSCSASADCFGPLTSPSSACSINAASPTRDAACQCSASGLRSSLCLPTTCGTLTQSNSVEQSTTKTVTSSKSRTRTPRTRSWTGSNSSEASEIVSVSATPESGTRSESKSWTPSRSRTVKSVWSATATAPQSLSGSASISSEVSGSKSVSWALESVSYSESRTPSQSHTITWDSTTVGMTMSQSPSVPRSRSSSHSQSASMSGEVSGSKSATVAVKKRTHSASGTPSQSHTITWASATVGMNSASQSDSEKQTRSKSPSRTHSVRHVRSATATGPKSKTSSASVHPRSSTRSASQSRSASITRSKSVLEPQKTMSHSKSGAHSSWTLSWTGSNSSEPSGTASALETLRSGTHSESKSPVLTKSHTIKPASATPTSPKSLTLSTSVWLRSMSRTPVVSVTPFASISVKLSVASRSDSITASPLRVTASLEGSTSQTKEELSGSRRRASLSLSDSFCSRRSCDLSRTSSLSESKRCASSAVTSVVVVADGILFFKSSTASSTVVVVNSSLQDQVLPLCPLLASNGFHAGSIASVLFSTALLNSDNDPESISVAESVPGITNLTLVLSTNFTVTSAVANDTLLDPSAFSLSVLREASGGYPAVVTLQLRRRVIESCLSADDSILLLNCSDPGPAPPPAIPTISLETASTVRSAAAGSVALASAGGAATAGDVQGAAIVVSSACAKRTTSVARGEYSLVSPVSLWDQASGALAGNALCLGGVFLLQIVALSLLHKHTPLKNRNVLQTCARIRFPAFTLMCAAALHQSTLFASLRILGSKDTNESNGVILLGGVAVLAAVVLPTGLFIAAQRTQRQFVKYNINTSVTSSSSLQARVLFMYVLPVGTTLPNETRLMASPLITSYRIKSPWCVTLPFISSFAVNLSGLAPLSACMPVMLFSAAAHLAIAGVIVRYNIYSSKLAGFMACLGTLLLATLQVCVGLDYHEASAPILMAQAMMSVVRSFIAVGTMILETRLRDRPGTTLAPVLWEVSDVCSKGFADVALVLPQVGEEGGNEQSMVTFRDLGEDVDDPFASVIVSAPTRHVEPPANREDLLDALSRDVLWLPEDHESGVLELEDPTGADEPLPEHRTPPTVKSASTPPVVVDEVDEEDVDPFALFDQEESAESEPPVMTSFDDPFQTQGDADNQLGILSMSSNSDSNMSSRPPSPPSSSSGSATSSVLDESNLSPAERKRLRKQRKIKKEIETFLSQMDSPQRPGAGARRVQRPN